MKLNLGEAALISGTSWIHATAPPYANTLIGRLSKGYRHRVGLAQALVHDPRILVLDGSTLGLDPEQIREVRQLIKGLSRDHPITLTTHILARLRGLRVGGDRP